MNNFEIRWATENDRLAIINTIREVYNGEEEFAKMADGLKCGVECFYPNHPPQVYVIMPSKKATIVE